MEVGLRERCRSASRLVARFGTIVGSISDGALTSVPVFPDLDAPRLRESRLGNADGENSVLKIGIDLRLVDSLRQLKGSLKRAVAALYQMETVILAFLSLAVLEAPDRKDPVFRRHLDVLGTNAGKLELYPELGLRLIDVDCRRPGRPVMG